MLFTFESQRLKQFTAHRDVLKIGFKCINEECATEKFASVKLDKMHCYLEVIKQ